MCTSLICKITIAKVTFPEHAYRILKILIVATSMDENIGMRYLKQIPKKATSSIVDGEYSGIESLKISYTLTKGCRFKLILFDAVSFMVTIVTLGLAYPVVLAARIHVYKQLTAA